MMRRDDIEQLADDVESSYRKETGRELREEVYPQIRRAVGQALLKPHGIQVVAAVTCCIIDRRWWPELEQLGDPTLDGPAVAE